VSASASAQANSAPSAEELDGFFQHVMNQWLGALPEFRDGKPQNDDLIRFVLGRKRDVNFGKRTLVPASEIDSAVRLYFDRPMRHHSVRGWLYKNGRYDSMKEIFSEGCEGRIIQVKSMQPLKNGAYSVVVTVDQGSYLTQVRWVTGKNGRRLILIALKKQ
jgi:hypothetical protein